MEFTYFQCKNQNEVAVSKQRGATPHLSEHFMQLNSFVCMFIRLLAGHVPKPVKFTDVLAVHPQKRQLSSG